MGRNHNPGPLREVTGWREVDGRDWEVLSCGHLAPPAESLMTGLGHTTRRCKKCKAGKPPELPALEANDD